MIAINSSDCFFYSVVECNKANMLLIGRFIQGIITCNPSIVLIMLFVGEN